MKLKRWMSPLTTLSIAALATACAHTTPADEPMTDADAATSAPQAPVTVPDEALVGPEVAALHQSFLALDTHLDTPAAFVSPRGFDIMARHSFARDGSQVDVPRMNDGGLDGGFWVIYTPQGELSQDAYEDVRDTAILRSLAIHDMVSSHPDTFGLATTAEDAIRINDEGKKIVFQSIENSYPLGEDLSLLETFYKLGVRMVGPVHSATNQFADSSTGEAKWNGLSPLGKQLVAEANRLGMVLDASHASDATLSQMIDLSTTPIILSHSGTNDVYDHPRNVPDELLVKLAEKGGVIQMNALGRYLADLPESSPERIAAMRALNEKWGNPNAIPADQYEAYLDEREALNKEFPAPNATFEDVMEQTLHALELIGPDHIGMGSDWDGGGGVTGFEDISFLPKVTARLLEAGYTEDDLRKIWGGNVLRLVKTAADNAETAE